MTGFSAAAARTDDTGERVKGLSQRLGRPLKILVAVGAPDEEFSGAAVLEFGSGRTVEHEQVAPG